MKIALTILLVFTMWAGQAQSVEQIVNKHLEKIGGVKKLKSINTRIRKMTVMAQGQEIPMTQYRKRPNKIKIVLEVQGMDFVTQAYDGKQAWRMGQMGGNQKIEGEAAKKIEEDDFDRIWIDYKKKGHTITLEGKEKIEEKECYKLKVKRKNGVEETYFINTVDYMIARRIGNDGKTITHYYDYKKVNGVMVPHKVKGENNGNAFNVELNSFKINEKIDDKIFAYPGD